MQSAMSPRHWHCTTVVGPSLYPDDLRWFTSFKHTPHEQLHTYQRADSYYRFISSKKKNESGSSPESKSMHKIVNFNGASRLEHNSA
jgi:hypothetical protein